MLAEDSGGGGPLFLLALGPAGGGGLYWLLYRYYRNTHQSHSFETETRVEAQSVTGSDDKIKRVTGTTRSRLGGDNSTNHRDRVKRVS